MGKVLLINDPRGSVSAHKPGCADISKIKKELPFFDDYVFIMEGNTTRDIWLDYNADFLEEGGAESAWDIKFYPCCEIKIDNDRSYAK